MKTLHSEFEKIQHSNLITVNTPIKNNQSFKQENKSTPAVNNNKVANGAEHYNELSKLFKKSNEKDWKDRITALDNIENFLKENNAALFNFNCNDFVEFFKLRVHDSNKTVAKAYIGKIIKEEIILSTLKLLFFIIFNKALWEGLQELWERIILNNFLKLF